MPLPRLHELHFTLTGTKYTEGTKWSAETNAPAQTDVKIDSVATRGIPDDGATPSRATLRSCNAPTAGPDGAAQVRLSASCFDASLIAELVNHGLVTLAARKGSESEER